MEVERKKKELAVQQPADRIKRVGFNKRKNSRSNRFAFQITYMCRYLKETLFLLFYIHCTVYSRTKLHKGPTKKQGGGVHCNKGLTQMETHFEVVELSQAQNVTLNELQGALDFSNLFFYFNSINHGHFSCLAMPVKNSGMVFFLYNDIMNASERVKY